MGLCTSKSAVTLDPGAHTMSTGRASRAAAEGLSPSGTPILDEGILMVQPFKSKVENVHGGLGAGGGDRGGGVGAAGGGGGGGGGMGGGRTKRGGAASQTAKGYLELGDKGEVHLSHEAEDDGEEEEEDFVEEIINLTESEGSLRSEFLE